MELKGGVEDEEEEEFWISPLMTVLIRWKASRERGLPGQKVGVMGGGGVSDWGCCVAIHHRDGGVGSQAAPKEATVRSVESVVGGRGVGGMWP